jgi:N-acetylglucosaminyldiphosphoundecaprenol N-acetyl-beta-D-mannosaminyltransferase
LTESDKPPAEIQFAGLTFRGLTLEAILPRDGQFKLVVTVNADFVVTSTQNPRFKRIVCDNHATLDGQLTWWLARLLAQPRGVPFEKISGASVIHDLLRYAQRNRLKAFFLGASAKVNDAAVQVARVQYGVDVAGYAPPHAAYPAPSDWSQSIIERIRSERPKLLFVAFGSPKQELWLYEHLETIRAAGVSLAMGCGGSLDFLSGALPRAPVWVQECGLEGVYRLLAQPTWFRARRLLRSLLVIPISFRCYMFGEPRIRRSRR